MRVLDRFSHQPNGLSRCGALFQVRHFLTGTRVFAVVRDRFAPFVREFENLSQNIAEIKYTVWRRD
jgi:hypothetical protein